MQDYLDRETFSERLDYLNLEEMIHDLVYDESSSEIIITEINVVERT